MANGLQFCVYLLPRLTKKAIYLRDQRICIRIKREVGKALKMTRPIDSEPQFNVYFLPKITEKAIHPFVIHHRAQELHRCRRTELISVEHGIPLRQFALGLSFVLTYFQE